MAGGTEFSCFRNQNTKKSDMYVIDELCSLADPEKGTVGGRLGK